MFRNLLLALTLLASTAGPALAWTEPTCTLNDKGLSCSTGMAYANQDGTNQKRLMLGMFVNEDGLHPTVGIIDARWNMPTRDITVKMRVDRDPPKLVRASTVRTMLILHVDLDTTAALQTGRRLYIDIPDQNVWFNLTGTRRAIDDLTATLQRELDLLGQSDPFAGEPERDPTPTGPAYTES